MILQQHPQQFPARISRPRRHRISQHLLAFHDWCAHAGIPELDRLARTIDQWWPHIETFIHTRITNATSEGINRVIKLVARNAFGFRNPDNQRLRVRCATTRQARGHLKPGYELRRPANASNNPGVLPHLLRHGVQTCGQPADQR